MNFSTSHFRGLKFVNPPINDQLSFFERNKKYFFIIGWKYFLTCNCGGGLKCLINMDRFHQIFVIKWLINLYNEMKIRKINIWVNHENTSHGEFFIFIIFSSNEISEDDTEQHRNVQLLPNHLTSKSPENFVSGISYNWTKSLVLLDARKSQRN